MAEQLADERHRGLLLLHQLHHALHLRVPLLLRVELLLERTRVLGVVGLAPPSRLVGRGDGLFLPPAPAEGLLAPLLDGDEVGQLLVLALDVGCALVLLALQRTRHFLVAPLHLLPLRHPTGRGGHTLAAQSQIVISPR